MWKKYFIKNDSFINTLFAALMREYQNEEKRFQKQLERTVEIEIIRAGNYQYKLKINLKIILIVIIYIYL